MQGEAVYKGFSVIDKVKNIGGYNFTYTRTRKMTIKDETSECSPI
jgi:hypothetical protein